MSSNNVDEKVVKMTFDNEQFEAGVKQTLNSLDELKKSLQFNNALTSLQSLSSVFNSFSLSNISSQVDTLSNKFSTLGIAGMTAVQNITNKVVDFTTSKLTSTLGQITSGGWARASSIAQSRFTLQGLLNDEEKVQEAFDSASNAVDGTAYSLNSAVAAASQLAASGVDVGEDMENTLKGIAGTAAMTGDSFDSIANIFTTVAGNGRLMGMQLTQLSAHGLNAAATIADYLGTTEAEVRDMTSKGEISFETFSAAMQEAFGEHAKDANKTFSGSMDNIKSALSRIGAIFSSGIIENDDLINALNDIRLTINSIKNAMLPLESSFKTLVSSASKLFSSVLGDVKFDKFENFVDCVGKAMEYVASLMDRWTLLNEKFKESVLGIVAEDAEEAAEDIYAATELIDAAWDIWNNAAYGTGSARKSALEEQFGSEGATIVQTLVNQIAKGNSDISNYAINDLIAVEEATEDVGDAMEDTAEKVKHIEPPLIPLVSIIKSFGHFAAGAKTIFDNIKTTVTKLASTFKKVFSWHDLIQDISDYGDMFSELMSHFSMNEERSNKLEAALTGLWSALDLVRMVIKTIVGGLTKSFGPALSVIYDIILTLFAKIGSLIERLKDWYAQNGYLKTIFEFLGNTLKSVIEFVANFFKELSKMSVLTTIKEKLLELAETISEKIGPYFGNAKDKVNEFFEEMNSGDSSKITDVVEKINGSLETLIEYVETGTDKLKEFFGYVSDKLGTLFGMKKAVEDVTDGVTDLNNATAGTSAQKASLFDKIPYFDKIMEFAKSFGSGLLERIKNVKAYQVVLTGFGASLIVLALNINSFTTTIKNSFKSFGDIGKAIQGVFKSISGIFNQIKKNIAVNTTLTLITKITILIGVLAASLIGLALVDTKKLAIAAGVMITILGLITAITLAFYNFVKKDEWGELIKFQDMVKPLSTLFLSLSASVFLLCLALTKLSEVKTEGIWLKFAVLASVTAVVAAMAIAISKFAPQIAKGGLSLIGYAAAVYILVKALIQLNEVDVEAIKGKLLLLIGIIITVGLVAATATRLAGINASSGFGLIAVIASLILLEVALNYIVDSGVDLDDIKNNLGKFVTVFAVLALVIASVKVLGSSTGKILGNVILLIAIVFALKTVATVLVQLAQAARSGGLLSGIMSLYAIFGGIFALLYIIKTNGNSISKASKTLLSIAGAIAVIAIVASLMGNIPFPQLAKGLGSIIVIVAALGTFMVLVSRLSKKKVDYKPLLAMSLAIVAVGTMIALISTIAKDNPEAVIISAIAIGLSLICLGLAYTLASKQSEKIHVAGLLTLISAIAVIGGVLAALTFLQTKGGSIMKSMIAIIAILGALTAAYYIIGKNDLSVDAKSISGLATLVSALVTIAIAIQTLNKAQETGSMLKSVIALTWLLAMLVNGVEVLSGLDKGMSWGVVASLGVLVVSLLIISVSLKALLDGDYSWGSMIVSALAMSIVLGIMVASLALLSNVASASPLAMIAIGVAAAALAVTLIGFSVAMISFAASIKILVGCLKELATIDYSAINVIVLVELCGVVALLGVASGIAAVGVVALSVGLAIIAASMLVAAVAISIMTPQIIALIAAFTAFTLIGDKVAAGIKVISGAIAMAIVEIAIGIANGIASFVTTIASRAPQITVAINIILASILTCIASSIVTINTILINGLISLLSMLEEKLPVLSEKLTHVIEIILQVIANNSIKFGYYGAVIAMNFVSGLILGLAAGIKPLMSSIGMFVLKFINGIGDAVYEYSDKIVASMQYLADVMYNSLLKALAATVPGVGALIGGEIEESNQRIEDWQEKRYTDIGEVTTDSLADSISDGTDKVSNASENMVDKATNNENVASDNAKSTSSTYIDGLANSFNSNSGSLGSTISGTLSDVTGIDLSNVGESSMGTLFSGMETGIEENKVDASGIPESIKAQLMSDGYEYDSTGQYLVKQVETSINTSDFDLTDFNDTVLDEMPSGEDGYDSGETVKEEWVNGMTSATEEEKARIYHTYSTLANEADEGARDALDINSPSKKAMALRDSWVEGFVKIDSEIANQVSSAYGDLANESITAAANMMSSISQLVQDDSFDWTPTLSPVIDGTQLQNGSNLLTATFGNSALNLAADTALSVKDANANSLAEQVAYLSDQVKKLADTDYSEMLKGVNINVNSQTNVDGTPLRKMASSYTIQQIDEQQTSYNLSRGARA